MYYYILLHSEKEWNKGHVNTCKQHTEWNVDNQAERVMGRRWMNGSWTEYHIHNHIYGDTEVHTWMYKCKLQIIVITYVYVYTYMYCTHIRTLLQTNKNSGSMDALPSSNAFQEKIRTNKSEISVTPMKQAAEKGDLQRPKTAGNIIAEEFESLGVSIKAWKYRQSWEESLAIVVRAIRRSLFQDDKIGFLASLKWQIGFRDVNQWDWEGVATKKPTAWRLDSTEVEIGWGINTWQSTCYHTPWGWNMVRWIGCRVSVSSDQFKFRSMGAVELLGIFSIR